MTRGNTPTTPSTPLTPTHGGGLISGGNHLPMSHLINCSHDNSVFAPVLIGGGGLVTPSSAGSFISLSPGPPPPPYPAPTRPLSPLPPPLPPRRKRESSLGDVSPKVKQVIFFGSHSFLIVRLIIHSLQYRHRMHRYCLRVILLLLLRFHLDVKFHLLLPPITVAVLSVPMELYLRHNQLPSSY